MDIDLRGVPFSRNGAFLAFSLLSASTASNDDRPGGLYLRSVHGGAQAVLPGGRMALLEPTIDGRPVPYQVSASPAELTLLTVRGMLRICIAEPFVIRVRGEGVGLRLTFNHHIGDYAIPAVDGGWRVNSPAFALQMMLSPLEGRWSMDAPWTGSGAARLVADMLPDEESGLCEAALEEYDSVWRQQFYTSAYDECVANVTADFNQWLNQTPSAPEPYAAARWLAAYINWSSMVEPCGQFLRPSMLMSKNWMTSVWSWDHCFNAMALTYRQPLAAWDQVMTLFDQQDEHGGLPDAVNDRGLIWNFCKPPIHGWTLQWINQRSPFIRADQVRQIYGPLCRWTEWWFHYRDDDQDGLPDFHHGNDSGWDNATPFDVGVPLESPDLCAFLILQMETLAHLARVVNHPEEAESWQRRAEVLLEKLLAHFWQGDHFVALRSGDHLVADTESLFLYLPLILGKRLPSAVRRELIDGLTRPGRFLTPFGLATESPASPAYAADGYWRGPIWAPSTFILVEGLAACGEIDLARDIARRFCDLCARSGFAENFNALTGDGLRDRAYTWTASVFLVLAHEYL
ncbi:MAG TPA: trehalase family glycosidase [Anaerolineaceae bacterium]